MWIVFLKYFFFFDDSVKGEREQEHRPAASVGESQTAASGAASPSAEHQW